ncbi:MFS transporter [Niallia sp. 01092]|uniref:MFS transporter n=1 Tax=Niallia sp. 01092 TaxID=3457759 RepID=UPI003FCFC6D2
MVWSFIFQRNYFFFELRLIKGNDWGWISEKSIACYIICVVSLILFIVTELKVQNPMVDLTLFKHRFFIGSTLSVSLGFIFLVGVMVLLPQFLTQIQGKTELQAALLITPSSATIFFFSTFAGWVVKKIGFAIPTILGFFIMGCSFYLLKSLSIDSPTSKIILVCFLLGLGFSFIISTATMASAASFEGELLTSSQSVFTMVRQIGVVLAVAIFVSSLTNSIDDKKHEVLVHAYKQVERLDVPSDVKKELYKKTELQLNKHSIDDSSSGQSEVNENLKREGLIKRNVETTLAKLPAQEREAQQAVITKEVTKQVDIQLQDVATKVTNYTKDISAFAKTSIASSFPDIYQNSFPFVLISSIVGLCYVQRRRNSI